MPEMIEPQAGGEDETRKSFPYEYVKELREENGRYRRQKTEAERERDELRTTGEKRIATALKQADERIIRAELKAEALKAGINDPADLKLVDISGLKLGQAGELEGAADLIAQLRQSKPYLFKAAAGTSGTGTPPRPGSRQARNARDMSSSEFRAALAKQGIKLPR
ncbi:MAG TPA: hypothetical protein VM689_20690 [Aliidongia sp.]|nr:hypothetical protein [Aliidongia sp.]